MGTKSRSVCRSRRSPTLVKSLGALTLETAFGEEACEKLWDLRRGFSESLKATGLMKLNEDVTVPRGKLVELMQFAGSLQERYGFPVACFGHAGDGNIHVNVMVAEPDKKEVGEKMERALDDLFRYVIACRRRYHWGAWDRIGKKAMVASSGFAGVHGVASDYQARSGSRRDFESGKIPLGARKVRRADLGEAAEVLVASVFSRCSFCGRRFILRSGFGFERREKRSIRVPNSRL